MQNERPRILWTDWRCKLLHIHNIVLDIYKSVYVHICSARLLSFQLIVDKLNNHIRSVEAFFCDFHEIMSPRLVFYMLCLVCKILLLLFFVLETQRNANTLNYIRFTAFAVECAILLVAVFSVRLVQQVVCDPERNDLMSRILRRIWTCLLDTCCEAIYI